MKASVRTLVTVIAASALFWAPSILAQNAAPSFDVAAINRSQARVGLAPGPSLNTSGRGGVFSARNATAHFLVQVAYGVRPEALGGGPDWVRTDTFDIEARASSEVPRETILLMLRGLLTARFGLELRREQRPGPGPQERAGGLRGATADGSGSHPRIPAEIVDRPATLLRNGMRAIWQLC